MKCMECGSTEVTYKGDRKDGAHYYCPKCKTGIVYDNGRVAQSAVKTLKR